MKLLPELQYLPYTSETHKEYYRKMPKVMAKYESALEKLGAEIIFEVQDEDIPTSDLMDNEESIKWVEESYESGNIYAWFCAKITVKYKDLEATDYLGGCSYKSEKDFKNGGYYYDMVNTCVEEINKDIEDYNQEVQKKWNIRKAKNLIAPYGLYIVASKELVTI